MPDVIETLEDTIERDYADGDYEGLGNTPYEGEEDSVTTPCGCDGSCPEIRDVTIEENTINIAGGSVEMTLAATSATNKTVSIQVVDEDGDPVEQQFELRLRFVDNANNLAEASPVPPTTPGRAEFIAITDEAGLYELALENASYKVWTLVCSFAGGVETLLVDVGA